MARVVPLMVLLLAIPTGIADGDGSQGGDAQAGPEPSGPEPAGNTTTGPGTPGVCVHWGPGEKSGNSGSVTGGYYETSYEAPYVDKSGRVQDGHVSVVYQDNAACIPLPLSDLLGV